MQSFRFLWTIFYVLISIYNSLGEEKTSDQNIQNRTNLYGIILDNNCNVSLTNITENVMCDLVKVESFYKDVRSEVERSVMGVERVKKGLKESGVDTVSGECAKKVELSDYDCRELRLAQNFLSALPPFAVTSSRVTNQKCLKDTLVFLEELNRFSTWALKMHDSSAKLPSGFLNGNVNQYGDFDQCLDVNSGHEDGIRGKYCLAYLDVQVSEDLGHLQGLHKLVKAHGAFRSTLEDPGHRVPRYSTINWGLCIPDSCQAKDVHLELEQIIKSHLTNVGLQVRVKVDPATCVVKKGWTLPYSTIGVGLLFLSVISLVALATIFHDSLTWQPGTKQSGAKQPGNEQPGTKQTSAKQPGNEQPGTATQLVQAFSLRKNVHTLLSVAPSYDDLESVHGIRFLNAYMLLISHKSMALFFNPYVNRTAMTETLGKPWTVIARAASLYTDPFVMLSGLLTSYAYFKHLENKRGINIRHEYASRMFRLVPNLAAIILFCTFILPWLSSGPQWSLVVDHHSDICKVNWWKNLLFIHNYFGFENMCLTHTHHLGIDTQLFVLAPALVYLLWRWPRSGGTTLLAIATFSTYLRHHTTFTKQLSLFVYFGTSVSQLFRTADLSYILPSHRLTVYIIGIFLGYALRHCGRQYTLKKIHLLLGWTLTAVLVYLALIEPARMGRLTYVYDPTDAANYAAYAPIFWCLVFAWIIFATHTGNGGLIGRAFSWRGFKVSTRLSYAIYLTQFPVFFYNVGRTRSAEYYTLAMVVNIPETIVIVIASVILTLLFDLPFQNIRNILIKKTKQSSS